MTFTDKNYYGNSAVLTFSVNTSIPSSIAGPRLYLLNTSTGSLNVNLPSALVMGLGWDVLSLANIGSQSLTIRDASSNTLFTLAVGEMVTLGLYDKASAAGSWAWKISAFNSQAEPLGDLVLFLGRNLAGSLTNRGLYDPRTEVWAAYLSYGTHKSDVVCRCLDKGYFLQRTGGAKFVEYVVDSFTIKADPTLATINSNSQIVSIGGKVIHLNFTSSFLAEEWDPGSNTWSALSPTGSSAMGAGKAQGNPIDAAYFIRVGTSSEQLKLTKFVRSTQVVSLVGQGGHLYWKSVFDTPFGSPFLIEDDSIHILGNGQGNLSQCAHRNYQVLTDSWISEVQCPLMQNDGSGERNPLYSTRAVYQARPASAAAWVNFLWEWDDFTKTYTQRTKPPTPSEFEGKAVACSIPR